MGINQDNRGIGRGPKTRDGCSVELYLKSPYYGEVELFQPWIPAGSSILELGCGVGRVTRVLLDRGYRVTAVDNSPEMLAHVPSQAFKICADIEGLALETAFDAVIFASCLINTPDAALRAQQLVKCREHLNPNGHLIFERFDPSWLSTVEVGSVGKLGDIEIHVDAVQRNGANVYMCLRYRDRTEDWLHCFTDTILSDDDVRTCLLSAGFTAPSWIDSRWGVAKVMGNQGSVPE
ncbi:MAG TPA: class I SAM-dependent methyltransferase [Polyangiaceae bacterium]|nr:class I SAM-dependent methyltransferase [Polyangiaceae bacterium]